ncbi:3-oxo-5-alpha-steroid 4 [Nannochloropsis gaditana]|uniref:3-oxo-5-alpha-steroid 4 n=2 Tax=Nannochloropsis gaditana TaxID=72520 RepID=W7TI71_9STRA|nr:3-oxo-5-alpha-steroid 4 [Nannochloropsis gaditana]
MPLRVTVALGKGKHVDLDLANKNATLQDLKEAFSKKIRRLSPHRQSFRIQVDSSSSSSTTVKLSQSSEPLVSSGYKEGMILLFKDLGPQIDYKTVFLLEYLGPILIMLLYASRPSFIYGRPPSVPPSPTPSFPPYPMETRVILACWVGHFVKRELETLFVHVFSKPTMALRQLFVNCAYYYAFALGIGYFICSPTYQPPSLALPPSLPPSLPFCGLLLFLLAEVSNLYCHLLLSSLRPSTTIGAPPSRPIPHGFLFRYLACPNYLCEVLAWVGFSLLTFLPLSFLFTLVGASQMLQWAQLKHKAYLKEHGDAYKKLKRRAMIPGIL